MQKDKWQSKDEQHVEVLNGPVIGTTTLQE